VFSSGAGKKDLGSAQHERIGGAQALLEDLVLLFGKRTDENWRFHDHYCSALHTTYLGCALGDFLLEQLYSFVGEGWEQEDDITHLTLKRSASLSWTSENTVNANIGECTFHALGWIKTRRKAGA
jgi:hypothetical protein